MLIRTLPLLFAVLVLIAPVRAGDEKNPILAEVKASLKEPTKPFTMIVYVKVKEGTGAKFEAAFAKARAGTRKETGNKTYEMSRSAKAPNEYIVYERWQDLSALQAHMKAPHLTAFLGEIGDMLASPPEVKVFIPTGN